MMQNVIWLAYITAEQQFYYELPFQDKMTVLEAIEQSQIAQQVTLPEPLQVGIFGVKTSLDQTLQVGDRVEIYRPLSVNPKDIRRKRAQNHPVGRFAKGNRFNKKVLN